MTQRPKLEVTRLSHMEYFLLGVSIVVILLEIFFIFRPTTVHVNKTISKLIDSEKNAKKLSKENWSVCTLHWRSPMNKYHISTSPLKTRNFMRKQIEAAPSLL
jgi:hypothetical protein